MYCISFHVVHPFNSMATTWKKSHFILLDRSDFHMIDNLSIAVHAFAKHMLTSLSINEMLPLMYVNLSSNFRGLPLRVKTAPFHKQHSLMDSYTWTHQCWLASDNPHISALCRHWMQSGGLNRSNGWKGWEARESQRNLCGQYNLMMVIYNYEYDRITFAIIIGNRVIIIGKGNDILGSLS